MGYRMGNENMNTAKGLIHILQKTGISSFHKDLKSKNGRTSIGYFLLLGVYDDIYPSKKWDSQWNTTQHNEKGP